MPMDIARLSYIPFHLLNNPWTNFRRGDIKLMKKLFLVIKKVEDENFIIILIREF